MTVVIAHQCTRCKSIFKPDTQSGISIEWFDYCVPCAPEYKLITRDIMFDVERERAMREEAKGNHWHSSDTGLPRGAKICEPSSTHEEYLEKVEQVWTETRLWDQRIDKVQIY